jgi:aromatic-L-amino-acid/L-tryptophan decarboxylase
LSFPLEPSPEQVREMLELVTSKLVEFLHANSQPANYSVDKAQSLASERADCLPTTTSTLDEILDELFAEVFPNALPTAHPGFMAYIPGGGIVHAGIADLITKITNRYVGIDATAPLLSQIETDVLKWFCEMVGYDDHSAGTLTSGGSIANLTAVICARTKTMGDDFSNGVVYASNFVHHSMWKAFHAAGVNPRRIRAIDVDEQFRLDVDKLALQMRQDIEQGLKPMMVVATAGSTNTGTIDSLNEIADLCEAYSAWYHVDAAYGGFFCFTEYGRAKLAGIQRADSITLDPHKGLFLPYGTGAILVKNSEDLKNTFSHQADYIPEKASEQVLWDFSELSLELTRPSRGLAIWLPFKMHGVQAFRTTLQEKLDLAQYFCEQLRMDSCWKIVATPELSLTVFKYSNSQLSKNELNIINRQIIESINSKGRVNLSGTSIAGEFVIRTCVLSFRTHQLQLDQLLEDLAEQLDLLAHTTK